MNDMQTTQDAEHISFEAAFSRLEQILERMNSNGISLDESLRLFKEADKLIAICNGKLSCAEREVEMLIKNRQGNLVLGSDQRPSTQDFEIPNPPPCSR
jgi:exodeoxyribonuclease VII small subunit